MTDGNVGVGSGMVSGTEQVPDKYTDAFVKTSILCSVKKSLNIPPWETAFDVDILMHINTVFSELHQLGVGPANTFSVDDEDVLWSDFTDGSADLDPEDLNMVQSYIYLEVRLMFDPPTASLLSALERRRDEYEWRLNVIGDKPIDWNDEDGNVDD